MSDLEGMEAATAAQPDYDSAEIKITHGDFELIVSNDKSSIQVDTNYNILACFVHDDSLDLEDLFLNMGNQADSAIDLPLALRPNENNIDVENSAESDNEMAILLEELRLKYASDASEIECFQTNPLLSKNSHYRVFFPEHTEDRTELLTWCTCSNCTLMPTNLESICCDEISNAETYIGDFRCIIEHEFFNIFCEREETVEIVLRTIGQVVNTPPQKHVNRLKRKAAYRSFTAWIHGYLGVGNRRPIPSCVVNSVRKSFPDPDEEYMGFKTHIDSPAEFMAFE